MRTLIIFLSFVTVSVTGFVACGGNIRQADAAPAAALTHDSLVSRGSYLVSTIGCDDCHSPKRMGAHGPEVIPELRLSGFIKGGMLPPVDTGAIKKGWALFSPDLTAAVGPWGISYAANITSDATGIGSWTEAQFIKSIREGKLKGLDNTRPMLPPMPWFNFAKLTDTDLKAIYTFLQSTNPVENAVPAPVPPNAIQ
ncbi:MAG: c-type cytochrome [Sphingobacteriales bacterium]|nr:c-type cytochrome [Sphingobacteriales bacterium]OJY85550.1 MAG: hypothetical protein BGP14_13860 [Sphingobacteriales bacterium 44-15]